MPGDLLQCSFSGPEKDIRVYRPSTTSPGRYVWTTPDGIVVHYGIYKNSHLNIEVRIPRVRYGGVAGRCGTWDGDRANDLTGINGTVNQRKLWQLSKQLSVPFIHVGCVQFAFLQPQLLTAAL